MVNSFYKAKAVQFLKHCENELFKLAVEQYKVDQENNFPLRVFDAVLVYEIPYCDACIISVYLDQYEYAGGAHGTTMRDSQTWNLQKCSTMKLQQLVRCSIGLKTYIVNTVMDQIKRDPSSYFEDYADLVSEHFNENNFYCTTEAVVVYYQQYDIAPYAGGIREFTLPYGGCVLDPAVTCFYV
ncbi:hypothetical protein SDC9_187185 [bioreactor metagenome]|uniref:DUF3298 domain-containing protein n=1 Tax=bioreactor metagenome TaxID=1076179 RepID=A0A645HKZ3_9ZZZZ